MSKLSKSPSIQISRRQSADEQERAPAETGVGSESQRSRENEQRAPQTAAAASGRSASSLRYSSIKLDLPLLDEQGIELAHCLTHKIALPHDIVNPNHHNVPDYMRLVGSMWWPIPMIDVNSELEELSALERVKNCFYYKGVFMPQNLYERFAEASRGTPAPQSKMNFARKLRRFLSIEKSPSYEKEYSFPTNYTIFNADEKFTSMTDAQQYWQQHINAA